ncbi:sensor histidine kinase [Clostridium sp.]|uniref:sensor histidine kinase n=1 Tax=Clostridium sp. TaxID=1506 RepID=UPI003F3DD99F
MDIKSKGKWIFGKIGLITNILIVVALGFSMYYLKINKMNFIIFTCTGMALLGAKLLISEVKILGLVYALDNTINEIDNKKTSISNMKRNYAEEFPGFLKSQEKVYKSIADIAENIRDYVQNKSKNEQVINRLINNVVHKLDKPVDNIQKAVADLKGGNGDLNYLEKEALFTKKLIQDLFESSKAASGVLNIKKETVPINYILKQAVAEFNSNIEESKLQYILNIKDEGVMLNIDPEKVWRVFQILLENTLKHSLDGTRVYIDSYIKDDKYILTIKSISKNPLNISEEDLYKRIEENEVGDSTGLPLETAKSIISTLNGELSIEIDGDLFKTDIMFNIKEGEKIVTP